MHPRPHIVFLREEEPPDPYRAAFEGQGWRVAFEPVLTARPVNAAALAESLRRPEAYGGLLLTSRRSAEALARRWETLPPGAAEAWRSLPAYTVGARAADVLRELGFRKVHAGARDAAALGPLVEAGAGRRPLLFLCGARRLDALPEKLRARDLPFRELCVYETQTRPPETMPPLPAGAWAAVFSPSGLDAFGEEPARLLGERPLAAIGRTTQAALEAAGLAVQAVAAAPGPEGLLRAVLAAAR